MSDDKTEQESDEIERSEIGTVWDPIDRDRAALTRTDRELLLGQKEYDSDQSLRNAEFRLREHARHSLLDMRLIADFLDQEELLKVQKRNYDEYSVFPVPSGDWLLSLGLRLKLNTIESPDAIHGGDLDEHDMKPFASSFEEAIESSIIGAIRSANDAFDGKEDLSKIDVDVSIEREDFNQERVLNELVHGSPTNEQYHTYLKQGDISLLRERLLEHDEVIEFSDTPTDYVIGPNDTMLSQLDKSD